jgi:tripartite-type tricarboxylate transporter receptor subunit TctC
LIGAVICDFALRAPAITGLDRTPPEIVTRLNEAVRQAVAAPEVRDRLVELGAEIFTQSPEEFGKFLKSEIERWKGVVAKYNISVQP